MLLTEASLPENRASGIQIPSFNEDNTTDLDRVFFNQDRIYLHKLARFNFTTYDVRRDQDNINPSTSHRAIMVLADNNPEDPNSPHFFYDLVLGIYHVNAIYTGSGTVQTDCRPRRLEFLWVRWFHNVDSESWGFCRLQSLRFPPPHADDAFGFVDPADVLRGCHIIPAFADGPTFPTGKGGSSRLAQDSKDWRRYYAGRRVITT